MKNKKYKPMKTETYSLDVLGINWTIKIIDKENSKDKLLGQTKTCDGTINIWVKPVMTHSIVSLLEVIAHEFGHAIELGLPVHLLNDNIDKLETSSLISDVSELTARYIYKMIEIEKDYKKKYRRHHG